MLKNEKNEKNDKNDKNDADMDYLLKIIPDFNYDVFLDLNKHLSSNTVSENIKYFLKNPTTIYKYEQIQIFIFCSGKSGSSTLYSTFQTNNYNALHTHYNELFILNHPMCFKNIYELIESNSKIHDQIYVFDSYRTPIERKISSFFQNINSHMPTYETEPIETLIDVFNDKFIDMDCYDSFDTLIDYFKLDQIKLKDTDFYYQTSKRNINFIKLKFSRINKWSDDLSSIMNKQINITSNNLTINKDYNMAYENFKKEYKIPLNYLILIISEENFQIFLSKDEIINYVTYWLFKSTPSIQTINELFNNVPDDFDPSIYKKINQDLQFMSTLGTKWHYQSYGYKEGRMYKYN